MTEHVGFICLRTGQIHLRGERREVDHSGKEHMWSPLVEAEPYFAQQVGSAASPMERTGDGRFDKSHLAPDKTYRIGRDYIAHAIRYGLPMKVIKEKFGPGSRILEMGCGKELPMFRTLTCDHGAVMHYKPAQYCGVDLNKVKYKPVVNGIESKILSGVNCVTEPEKIPDWTFDIVTSFEVLEHMDKPDGEMFIDAAVKFARRKPERENGAPGLVLLSTPVNGGRIAKNHIYEWGLGELRRGWLRRGCSIVAEYGTFANISELVNALDDTEVEVWNRMAKYHSPHLLSCMFAAMHPNQARNVVWLVEVPLDAKAIAS